MSDRERLTDRLVDALIGSIEDIQEELTGMRSALDQIAAALADLANLNGRVIDTFIDEEKTT
jgi:hypothetical protein